MGYGKSVRDGTQALYDSLTREQNAHIAPVQPTATGNFDRKFRIVNCEEYEFKKNGMAHKLTLTRGILNSRLDYAT